METRDVASNAAKEVTRLGGTVGGLNSETFGAVSLGGTVSGSNSRSLEPSPLEEQ
jgi:hypothetical protein